VKSFEIDKRLSRWLAMYKLKRLRGRFAKAMASFWPCPARCSQGAAAGMTLAGQVDSSRSAGAVALSGTGGSCLIGDFGQAVRSGRDGSASAAITSQS